MIFKYFSRILFVPLIIISLPLVLYGNNERRVLPATRVDSAPNLDGHLSDPQWNLAEAASGFFQYEPHNDRPASFKSEVRVLYDDNSIYIGAFLHDPQPDSILTELGLRDSDNRLNADQFWVDINPFNDGLNSFRFKVSASGVQTDVNFSAGSSSRGDINWDAVWKSNVSITSQGWIVEMEIPYSALRFPKTPAQEWGINFWREVRRTRESSSWNFVDRTIGNLLASKGILANLEGIKPPLRLSFYPYVTAYVEKNGLQKNWRSLLTGGMDLKYGISESFTLDVALIPDFGQVKSDDQVLNLSPFEIKFDENRQFFTEGVDLFSKADLFYSRRIGSSPTDRSKAYSSLNSNEILLENPTETRLINASKLSGRTSRGLGIGVFNAITDASYAILLDTLAGTERRIKTQPLTNYNLVVLDQSLSNNSSVSLINTNVYGSIDGYTANVTGTEFQVTDRSNMYRLSGSGALSQQYYRDSENIYGFKYNLSAGKYGGTWQYRYARQVISNRYNQNDMGFMRRNNLKTDNVSVSYNSYNPRPSIINTAIGLGVDYSRLFEPSAFTNFEIEASYRILYTSRLFFKFDADLNPFGSHDYYETRTPGRFYKNDPQYSLAMLFSTDYRKRVFWDGNINFVRIFSDYDRHFSSFNITPTFRASDRLNISYRLYFSLNKNDIGYIKKTDANDILFGKRDNKITVNSINARYIFNNKLSFDIQLRHYWSRVVYDGTYFALDNDGSLEIWNEPVVNNNINYNAFTVDSRLIWNFAPGSQLSLVWKNNIESARNEVSSSFIDNLQQTLGDPQINSISIKILYYLDYQKLKNIFSS